MYFRNFHFLTCVMRIPPNQNLPLRGLHQHTASASMFSTRPSGVTGSRLAAEAVGGGGVRGFQPPPEYGHQYPKTHRSQSEVFFQLAHDFPRQWDRKFFCLGILSFEDCVWGHLHCDYINFQIQTKDICLWSVRADNGAECLDSRLLCPFGVHGAA